MMQDPEPSSGPPQMRETPTWIHIAEQAAQGDERAFARVVEVFQEEIHRMVYFRTGSEMDADDITQDVFLKAFKHIRGLKDPRHLRGWLYRVALNAVRDHHRRRRVRALFERKVREEGSGFLAFPGGSASGGEGPALRREFWDQVRHLMERLSRLEKEVFMLRFFDDLKIREISVVIKRSESTVKTHLHRAVKKLAGEPLLRERMEGL